MSRIFAELFKNRDGNRTEDEDYASLFEGEYSLAHWLDAVKGALFYWLFLGQLLWIMWATLFGFSRPMMMVGAFEAYLICLFVVHRDLNKEPN